METLGADQPRCTNDLIEDTVDKIPFEVITFTHFTLGSNLDLLVALVLGYQYIYIYSHRTIYRTCQYIHMTWIVDLCNSRLVGKCTSPIDPKSIYVCIYYVGGHCTSSNNATPDRSGRVYAGRSRSFAAQYCFWDFCCVPRSIEPTRQECIWLFNHD